MADVTDVVDTLVGLISGLLYPNGTANPPSVRTNVRVFAGWPIPDQLDTDLANTAAGTPAVPDPQICQVSVYPLPAERNTTRYLQQWQQASINTPTLTLTAAGQTVTVGGTIPPASNPHNAVIFANGVPYAYAVQPADTLASIATALATLINVVVTGTLSAGPIVTLAAGARLGAVRIGVTGTSVNEIARQEKQFSIIVWADSPQHRTAIAKVIDPALKAMTFIALPDLSAGRIRYFGNRESDNAEKQGIYRRDLIFTVEYATLQTQINTQITAIGVTVQSPAQQSIDTIYE
jgi:hypothetical protein